MMQTRLPRITLGVVLLAGFAWYGAARGPFLQNTGSPVGLHQILPAETEAAEIVNTTQRHREWVSVPLEPSGMRVFAVYPGRADNAPVVIVTAKKESASQWVRAIAIRAADEGFIAVVPDLLSGMAPNGGDGDSFATSEAIAT